MPIQLALNKSRVPVKVFTQDIDHDALQQLLNVAQLPIVFGHGAVSTTISCTNSASKSHPFQGGKAYEILIASH